MYGYARGIWHNRADIGSGFWKYEGNNVFAKLPTNPYRPQQPPYWVGILVQSHGTEGWGGNQPQGDGRLPEVTFIDNTVDGRNIIDESEWDKVVGVYFYENVSPEAEYEFDGNTFANVDIGAWVSEGKASIDLSNVRDSNIFPEGSQVIGDKILAPKAETVYNKTTGAEYDSIQIAVNEASDNNTILVGPGEYDIDELLVIDKPLVLRGASAEHPAINLPDSYKECVLVEADNVTLEHLHFIKEFIGDDGSDFNCILSIPRGGSWSQGYKVAYRDITLRDLVFEGGRTGAYITAGNLTIEDCLFKDQHSKILYFNIVAGTTCVKGNTFLGDSGHAIRFEGFSDQEAPHSGNITIENNVVEGKATS